MSRLPKFNIPGHIHFVTTKTIGNKKIFKDNEYCGLLLKDIDFYRNKLGFKLFGYCLMPDHVHLIVWWDPDQYMDLTISKIIQGIKGHSARQIIDYLKNKGRRGPLTSSEKNRLGQGTQATRGFYPHRRMSEQQYKIWQPSFYDFNIYSEYKFEQKLNYIHNNPVKAGIVNEPCDYKYSSARNYHLGDESLIKIDRIEI